MLTFSFKPFGYPDLQLPLTTVTIRDYMIQNSSKFPQPAKDGNSFFWSFIDTKNHTWINTYNNRNKLMTDYFKDGDRILCSLWVLGSPQHGLYFSNNLVNDQAVHETECAICFEILYSSTNYAKVLECRHCYHACCITDLNKCPTCNFKFSNATKRGIQYLVRVSINDPYWQPVKGPFDRFKQRIKKYMNVI